MFELRFLPVGVAGQGGFLFTSPSAGSQPVNLIPPITRRSHSQSQ